MQPIWQRRAEESDRWYQRFEAYLAMGPSRSVLAVYRAESNNPKARSVVSSWREPVKRHEWHKRAAAWDLRADEIIDSAKTGADPDQESTDQKRDRSASGARSREITRSPRISPLQARRIQRQIDWELEREALRERQLDMANMLYEKALDMLERELDGGIKPNWSMRDAEAFIKTSSTLTEAAVKMGDEQASRRQLIGWHNLAQMLLTMDDAADMRSVKQMVSAFLDASLLDLGKPARGQLKQSIDVAANGGER
jgi:hypothetical protein